MILDVESVSVLARLEMVIEDEAGHLLALPQAALAPRAEVHSPEDAGVDRLVTGLRKAEKLR